MPVSPLNNSTFKKADYLINNTQKWYQLSGRDLVTKLDKPGALLPVLLLEATVTGGRTYQAYQRDGFVEARERVTEESLGAVFWLFGAKIFEKMFDFMGKKFGKMPKESYDVAHDASRSPLSNFVDDIVAGKAKKGKVSTEKEIEAVKDRLARFSCGKTIAGLITACLFIGLVVPKLNQAITKHLYKKFNGDDPKNPNQKDNLHKISIKDFRALHSAKYVSINAVENFKARKGEVLNSFAPVVQAKPESKTSKANPSFKGAETFIKIVQNFQENDVWKLLGTDVGTVTGRTANARNNDERVEIMFRDLSSIYFYCFSTAAIIGFLNKHDAFKGLNTKLNPNSAADVHNELVNAMDSMGKDRMSAEEFKKMALGVDRDEALYQKIFPEKAAPPDKKILGIWTRKAKKPLETITLPEFEAIIDSHVADKARAANLKQLAKGMTGMQPLREGAAILTESQVDDVLRGGVIRKPEVMKRILNNIFKTKNHPDILTDPYKYISHNNILDRRERILNYVESLVENAKKKGVDVDWANMKQMNKRNLHRNGLYMAAGLGVSALFLSTIIPKVQYFITFLRTGKNTFPGVENMEQKKQQKAPSN